MAPPPAKRARSRASVGAPPSPVTRPKGSPVRAPRGASETALRDVLGSASLDAPGVHRLHRELRRLRASIDFPASHRRPPAGRRGGSPLDARILELARSLGEVRDLDVFLGLLDRRRRQRVPGEGKGLRRARERARLERAGSISWLRRSLRRGSVADLTAGVRDSARRLRDEPRGPAEWDAAWDDRWSRVLRAFRRADRRPSGRRWHRLRIELRDWVYLSSMDPAAAARRSGVPGTGGLARLQRRLGRIHDLELGEERARADGLVRWAEDLRKRRRRRRDRLRKGWPALGRPGPDPSSRSH